MVTITPWRVLDLFTDLTNEAEFRWLFTLRNRLKPIEGITLDFFDRDS